jgi:hypothetical protein
LHAAASGDISRSFFHALLEESHAVKRTLIVVLLAIFVFPIGIDAKPKAKSKKAKKPCAVNLAACPDQGCGKDFDPNLNKLKNITSNSNTPTSRALASLQALADPQNFNKGDPRDELAALGEGQVATVVAYLIAAKAEGAESCNCGLTGPKNTDNHLVVVEKATLNKPSLHARELKSTTMEITPRVRLDHPKWTKASLDPLINGAPKKGLLVRITGQLLFDSEHFLGKHLIRVNNWEIHPILGLEFCPKAKTCTAGSDANWKRLDDQ